MSQEILNQRRFFLNVVPKEYLIGIIKEKKFSEEELKKKLEDILNKRVLKPKDKINKLSYSNLIKLFIKYDILSLKQEKNLFFQFRDSKNPIFYLYKFKGDTGEELEKIRKIIANSFSLSKLDEICEFKTIQENQKTQNALNSRYKEFKVMQNRIFQEKKIIEFNFEYLERIDYLDKTYAPKFVYSLKYGLFWLDKRNQLVIIKCQNERIVEAIISLLEKCLKSTFWKFNLHKNIVDKLFDFKKMIKIALKSNKNINPELLESIIIRDKKYAEKLNDPIYKFLLNYQRRMGSYHTSIKGFSRKIKVNVNETGKISLVGKSIKLDKCREWLIETLLEIIKIQEELWKSGNITSYINSSDCIKRSNLYKQLKNEVSRAKLFELIEKIIILKEKPDIDSIEFIFPPEISYYYRHFIIPFIDLRCSIENCNASLLCPNLNCESIGFIILIDIKKKQFNIKCNDCGFEISSRMKLKCIDNHENIPKLNESFLYLFTPEIKIEINKILKDLEIGYKIDSDKEIFFIERNALYRKIIDGKIVYKWDELPIFQKIPKMEELSNEVRKNQVYNIKDILEKCNKRKGRCRACDIGLERGNICLLKIFAKLSEGQAHPHTGTEFGDFEFPEKFSYGIENIIGIAKSYKKPKKSNIQNILDIPFSLLTFKRNDHLFEQFFQLIMDGTVRFIMVVSGRLIDTRLKNALIEIAKWRKKKVVIIGPKELIPIFAYYF